MNPLFLASTEPVVDMTKVVTDGLTNVAGNMSGVISSTVPVALGIVVSYMVVLFGIRLFKRLTQQ